MKKFLRDVLMVLMISSLVPFLFMFGALFTSHSLWFCVIGGMLAQLIVLLVILVIFLFINAIEPVYPEIKILNLQK